MKAEQEVSQLVRAILGNLPLGEDFAPSWHLNDLSPALELFLPGVLCEVYPEWNKEGLDGIIPVFARKIGDLQVEVFGLCILISDETLTPIHLRLQVADSMDEVCWLECRLGEMEKQRMVRIPCDQLSAAMKRLHRKEHGPDDIHWVYKVTFGQQAGDER